MTLWEMLEDHCNSLSDIECAVNYILNYRASSSIQTRMVAISGTSHEGVIFQENKIKSDFKILLRHLQDCQFHERR